MMDTPALGLVEANNEWYSPSYIIDAARNVLGGTIYLDPASCAEANQTVQAARYFTAEEDGLARPWLAKTVWLNPPFTASASIRLPQFVWGSRLIEEYKRGNVESAILLIMAATKQKWFHRLWAMHTGPVCFSEKRIHFNRPGNVKQELRESTCLIYLGMHEDKFIEEFRKFGTIAKRLSSTSTMEPIIWEGWNND